MMTTQRKLEIFAALVVVALAALFLRGWQLEREARIRAEAGAAADQKLIQAREAAIRDRDAQAAQYAAALQRQAATIQTPQQAAQVILHYLPPAPGQAAPTPIAQVDRTQLSPEVQKTLPDAPSFSLLTPAQVKQIAKDELACDATRHNLTACQQAREDLTIEIKTQADETEKWKQAAKGGTKLQRFGRVLRSVACAGGGAAAGAVLARQNPSMGAAIGAGAGVAGCSLF